MAYDILNPLFSDIPEGWEEFFSMGDVRDILNDIQTHLSKETRTIVPLPEDVFNVFRYCSPSFVKVIIWGQDPYYTTWTQGGKKIPVATGMSFSISRKNSSIPPSLQNIYKEIERSYTNLTDIQRNKFKFKTFEIPEHGDLRNWVKQGVFLLNKSLTTVEGIPEAHLGNFNPWEGFIVEVLKYLKKFNPIHVFWGKKAESIKELGVLRADTPILASSHPSPKSAHISFFGNDHFVKINICLRKRWNDASEEDKKYFHEIDWNL